MIQKCCRKTTFFVISVHLSMLMRLVHFCRTRSRGNVETDSETNSETNSETVAETDVETDIETELRNGCQIYSPR